MASIKVKAKKIFRELPYPIGRLVSFIPFRLIFGRAYHDFKKEIIFFNDCDTDQQKNYILKRLQSIVTYSYHNIPFYNDFYRERNFHPDQVNQFEDIEKIPILTKDVLVKHDLSKRSASQKASEKINTGGTTGQPLEFYIEQDALAREWAHMLTIWSQVGYKRTDLKLNFRGRNIGNSDYKYNAMGNEYIINTFADFERLSSSLKPLLKQRNIRYLHGYPSAIYEFGKHIKNNDPFLLRQLNETLKGILLGSEYPAPVYRSLIDEVFNCPSISWYGHSEMCILAYEKTKKSLYEPMGSYGYCEALEDRSGNYRLIGTSFYNDASPLIRYDTGDLVKPVTVEKGLLKSFEIEKGRVGEFIVDAQGHRVSLTALIFGRHHPVFGKAKFVQVYQPEQGKATIFITATKSAQITEKAARDNFDGTNVDLNIEFKIIEEPYRTQSGKVPLLVRESFL